MKKFVACIALVPALGLALSGCGSKSDPVAAQAKTSLAKQLTDKSNANSILPISNPTTATCVANGIVDKVGVKGLIGYGMIDAQGNAVAADLAQVSTSAQDAAAITDTVFSCVGDDAVVAAVRASITRPSKLSAAAKTCLTNTLTKDTIRTILIAEMQGSQTPAAVAVLTPLRNKMITCTNLK